MARWQAAEAEQRFSELVEAAGGDGPQVVIDHEEPVAVVLSPDEYRRLVRQADTNFGRLLAQSLFGPGEVEQGSRANGHGAAPSTGSDGVEDHAPRFLIE